MFAINWLIVGLLWAFIFGILMINMVIKFLLSSLTTEEGMLMVLSIIMFSLGVGIAFALWP